ncbi:MAG: winged helix-turn-helix domain-containing protein [Methylococcales bacterium]
MNYSKTKTSFYRRLYVAYLIDSGINTVPKLIKATGMPKRTAQDTIKALSEHDITCEFQGATKDGYYLITDWAAIKKNWIKSNLKHVIDVLEYPQ